MQLKGTDHAKMQVSESLGEFRDNSELPGFLPFQAMKQLFHFSHEEKSHPPHVNRLLHLPRVLLPICRRQRLWRVTNGAKHAEVHPKHGDAMLTIAMASNLTAMASNLIAILTYQHPNLDSKTI